MLISMGTTPGQFYPSFVSAFENINAISTSTNIANQRFVLHLTNLNAVEPSVIVL